MKAYRYTVDAVIRIEVFADDDREAETATYTSCLEGMPIVGVRIVGREPNTFEVKDCSAGQG